jgi:hypothetical protein
MHGEEPIWIPIRERPKDDMVDDAEDRRVRTDAKG